jgi:hypothetical protein
MTKLNITMRRVSKERGTQDPDLYIRTQGPDGGSNGAFDPANNFALVFEQCRNFVTRDILNATSTFKCYDYGSISTEDGYCVTEATMTVLDMSTIPGLTVDNAFEMCKEARINEGVAGGIGDYVKWKFAYWDEYFNLTTTVTTED